MDERTFKQRTKKFALDVIRLVETLPRTPAASVISRQLLRSATSVGANYRAACRGRSTLEVLAKLGIVEEEADESIYWMELLVDSNAILESQISGLKKEGNELIAMTVASIKTLRNRKQVKIESTDNPKSKI
jgi:four helix bundle protein